MGSPYYEEKKGIPVWGIVLIVVGAVVLLAMIILVAAGVLYTWSTGRAETESREFPIMAFEVKDGVNRDATHGCFFTIRAKKGVDIDPSKYFFYVAEKGRSPKALEFGFRHYQDQGEDDLTPVGGDRNKSYRYDEKNWKAENTNVEAAGSMWSDGEYIGFDMPMVSMGIDIVEGRIYEVMIKNPSQEVVYQGSFTYQVQMSS